MIRLSGLVYIMRILPKCADDAPKKAAPSAAERTACFVCTGDYAFIILFTSSNSSSMACSGLPVASETTMIAVSAQRNAGSSS